jgi:hypothetical protein
MTKQGSINLNVNLLKTPEDVIDYIYIYIFKSIIRCGLDLICQYHCYIVYL